MKENIEQLRALRLYGQQQKAERGKIINNRSNNEFKFIFIGIFILMSLLSFLVLTAYFMAYHHKTLWVSLSLSWKDSLELGLAAVFLYFIYPAIYFIFYFFKYNRRPGREFLQHFHDNQILGCVSVIVFFNFSSR